MEAIDKNKTWEIRHRPRKAALRGAREERARAVFRSSLRKSQVTTGSRGSGPALPSPAGPSGCPEGRGPAPAGASGRHSPRPQPNRSAHRLGGSAGCRQVALPRRGRPSPGLERGRPMQPLLTGLTTPPLAPPRRSRALSPVPASRCPGRAADWSPAPDTEAGGPGSIPAPPLFSCVTSAAHLSPL